MNRYRVTLTPDGQMFGILDREQYDWCGLPDEDGNVQRLEWKAKPSAEAWLQMCYRLWQIWESDGGGKTAGTPPKGWRPRPPETSPFDRGFRFYN